jgi:ATP-binding cassette, subfamily B, heavy metal transporter
VFQILPNPPATAASSDSAALRRLIPYFFAHKGRVLIAFGLMVAAKSANIGIPLLLKELVDNMAAKPSAAQAAVIVPLALIVAYGLLRLSTTIFTELREWVMAKATEGASRRVGLEVFQHLHNLSLRFHLERQTGGMSRDIERGTRSVHTLVSYALYSVVPTLLEVVMVLSVLAWKFSSNFVWVTLCALVAYIAFTVTVTEWRTQFRKRMNELDTATQAKAVDSLLNYETVKYFNNEGFELNRYDSSLSAYRAAALKSQTTLSLLNTGQQLIIASALIAMLWLAASGVAQGHMSLGDLVMVNAFMIQLYIPLNFLGVIYREIKQALTDLRRMFELMDRDAEVKDSPTAQPLVLGAPPAIRFDNVNFAYEADRPILHEVSFEIPAGKTVAVVGPSGCGKSTLARLLYRFYDIQSGQISVNGQPLAAHTLHSLRSAIGVVPQDTVLFNDSIGYNIGYGRVGEPMDAVQQAARGAHVHDFIVALPKGYDTVVGERGLKLSGGEKQRVAIARTLLKSPQVFIFDEATSALDSDNERAIQHELQTLARSKTALVIAHRLSTITDAHEILVMDAGRIIERGTHAQLLALQGRYANMWALQQSTAA